MYRTIFFTEPPELRGTIRPAAGTNCVNGNIRSESAWSLSSAFVYQALPLDLYIQPYRDLSERGKIKWFLHGLAILAWNTTCQNLSILERSKNQSVTPG